MRVDAAIEAFVVSNVDYYRRSWQRLRGGKRVFAGFNWAACLGQVVWLLYRKLYGPLSWVVAVSVAHLSLMLASVFTGEQPFASPQLLSALNLTFAVLPYAVVGTSGNYWYWKKFSQAAHFAEARAADQAYRLHTIRSRGGTNPIGALLLAVVLALPVILALYQAKRVDVSGYVFDAEGR